MCYDSSSFTKCAESESYQSFQEPKKELTANVNSDTNGHTRTSSDNSIIEGPIESRRVELLWLNLILQNHSLLEINCLATIDDNEKKPQSDDESTDQEVEADSTKSRKSLSNSTAKMNCDKNGDLNCSSPFEATELQRMSSVATSKKLMSELMRIKGKTGDKTLTIIADLLMVKLPIQSQGGNSTDLSNNKLHVHYLMENVHQLELLRQITIHSLVRQVTIHSLVTIMRCNRSPELFDGSVDLLLSKLVDKPDLKARFNPPTTNVTKEKITDSLSQTKSIIGQKTEPQTNTAVKSESIDHTPRLDQATDDTLSDEYSTLRSDQGQSFHGLENKQSPPEHMKSVVPNGTTRSKKNPTDTGVSTSSSPVNESASELSEARLQNCQIQQDHILGFPDEMKRMKQPTTAIDKNEIEQTTTTSICNSLTNNPCAPIFITIGADLQPTDPYDDLTLDNSSEKAVVVDLVTPSEEQPGSEHNEVTAHIPQSGGLSSLIPLSQLAPETNTKKVTIDVTCNEVPDLETWSETFNSLTIQVFKHYQTNDAPFFQAPIIAFFLDFDPATLLNQRKRFSTLLDRLSTFSTIHENIDVSSIEAASAGFVARQGIEPEFDSCSALLCLECCLVVDNIPRNVVIVAVHKTYSEKCKFILDFEQLNSSVDETAVAIPTSNVNGPGALSSMVVPGMVTKSEQSSEENNGTSDVSRRYDHIVMYSSKLLPVRKDDLTKGWSPKEMLDALPEGRAALNVLDIDPTIDGLSTMMSEETRKESFRTYPNDLLLNITQLCAAGYFWTGKENVMRCCGCGVEHSGWDRNVQPLTRHLQLSPNCVFLKRSLTPEYLNSELVKIKSPYTPEARVPRKERVTKRDVALYIDSRAYTNIRDNPEKFGPPEGNRRKLTNELYKSVEYMRKFNLPIPGKEPEVIEMLKEMREREKKESKSMITNRPDRHVLAAVTHQFDENMQRQASELERKQQARRSQNRPDQQQPLTITQEINANEIAQSMRCKICLDKLCGLLLLPCSHIATCAGCGMSQGLCPICRGKITATTSIRFF